MKLATVGAPLAITALLLTTYSAWRWDLFNTRSWTFQGVSTASKPSDPSLKLRGNEEYSIVKSFVNPNGWRADVTWSAPRNPGEILSIEDENSLPFKFSGAFFWYTRPEEIKKNFPWPKVLEQAQKENGPWTGRVGAGDSSEFVYWGRVSIRQGETYNCATDCLVLFHWGTESDHYTVHLFARMPPHASPNAVP